MNEISKYLYKFLDNELLKNKTPITFQSSYENMDTILTNIISDVYQAQLSWNTSQIDIKETILSNNMGKDEIPKGTMYKYISSDAQYTIQSSRNCGRQYSFIIDHQQIEVFIVYVFSENDPPQRKLSNKKLNAYFKDCLYRIFIWLSIAYKQKHSECSQTLKIYLYLTDLFKIIPEKKENIIDVSHANTAITRSCAPFTEIHVFREEEWFKVFIHESFHCLGFDFSHIPEFCEKSKSMILDVFNVRSDVNLFETWCEMWGELFNIIIYVTIHNKGKPVSFLLNKVRYYLKYEQLFSVFQCVKVLHHQELNYEDIISQSKITNQYNENTNVLSYYIIKSILLFFIDDFFIFMKNSNESSLVFVNRMENIQEYCNLIKKNHNNRQYLVAIRAMEYWYNKLPQLDYYSIENITLRMTVLEW